MNKITHKEQQQIWDKEHQKPYALLQMHNQDPSGGVVKFFNFIKNYNFSRLIGIEMGCGKGRNVIYLASQKENEKVYGFDFSTSAIGVAKERSKKAGVSNRAEFSVGDATFTWPYKSNSFDYVIDNFTSTDIESIKGRFFAIKEIKRVLKPGGFLMVYTLTPDDEFHKEMIQKNPAEEQNSFYYSTGKFEKTFLKEELEEMYEDFRVIRWESVNKVTQFFGKEYPCFHYWMIFQKMA